MAAPSLTDYLNDAIAQAQLLRSGVKFLVGQFARMLAEGAASMADRLTGYAAGLFKATFLDGAEGSDLTTLCDDHWGIQRNGAVQASVTLTFARPTFAAAGGTIAAGSIVATQLDANGVEVRFTTDSNLVFGATDLSKTVTATAVTGGIAGNVAASSITRIISTLWDSTLTVTNAGQAVGGSEAETDAQLRERVRQFPSTIRRGTFAALEYGARQTTGAGVSFAHAVDDGTGLTTVYVTDANGNSTGTTQVVSSSLVDDGSMTMKVAIELVNWAAAGSYVAVTGGSPVTQNLTIHLTVRAGVDSVALQTLVNAAIATEFGKLNVGDTLYMSALKAAAKAVNPDAILDVTVPVPNADVTPSANQRLVLGTISYT